MSQPSDRTGIRVNLTLPPEVVATIDRMAKVTKAGRASIIREFLVEATPGLQQMARALELAAEKNADAFKLLASTLDKSVNDAQQLSLEIKAQRRRIRRKKS